MRKTLINTGKREKENRQLYEYLHEEINLMQQLLRNHYQDSDEIKGDVIHGIVKGLYFLKRILFRILRDETPTKEILDGLKRSEEVN